MEILTLANLSQRIQMQRKQMGLTQTQLALLCNVGVRFVSDFENGKKTIQMGKALQVLNALGLSLKIQNRKLPGF